MKYALFVIAVLLFSLLCSATPQAAWQKDKHKNANRHHQVVHRRHQHNDNNGNASNNRSNDNDDDAPMHHHETEYCCDDFLDMKTLASRHWRLVIGVTSASGDNDIVRHEPTFAERRQMHRSTWMQLSSRLHRRRGSNSTAASSKLKKLSHSAGASSSSSSSSSSSRRDILSRGANDDVLLLHVIGHDGRVDEALLDEMKRHGDVLLLRCHDGNNFGKVFHWFDWVVENLPSVDYVAKLDDESYVWLDRLLAALDEKEGQAKAKDQLLMMGFGQRFDRQVNGVKYKALPWMRGWMYVLDIAIVRHIVGSCELPASLVHPKVVDHEDVMTSVWIKHGGLDGGDRLAYRPSMAEFAPLEYVLQHNCKSVNTLLAVHTSMQRPIQPTVFALLNQRPLVDWEHVRRTALPYCASQPKSWMCADFGKRESSCVNQERDERLLNAERRRRRHVKLPV
jgi:Galactosyltransferase